MDAKSAYNSPAFLFTVHAAQAVAIVDNDIYTYVRRVPDRARRVPSSRSTCMAAGVYMCLYRLIPLQPLLCVALCGIDIYPATVIQWFT